MQSYDKKQRNPLCYYSRRCNEVESKTHSYELEVLAVEETLERFRIYLLGKPFTLITDCAAIASTKKQTELKAKIARWWLKLLEYDFVVVHRQGTRLAHVDALYRAPREDATYVEEAGFVFEINENSDWLLTMQMRDEKLKEIIAVLTEKQKSPQTKQLTTEYVLNNFRLYRKTEDGNRFVVPKAIRAKIVDYCYDQMGHFGLKKTLERIKRTFWFPKMRKYAKEYIASCIICCYNKTKGGKIEGEMHINDILPIPFASVHIDHLGPFIRSKRGQSYILAISDAFTKALIVKAVRNTKTMPVISAINEMTTYFGFPYQITTDRGTAYMSKMSEVYGQKNHIRHIKCAVRSPNANGQVRTTAGNTRDWDMYLRDLQWTVNSQKNNTTGFSPNE